MVPHSGFAAGWLWLNIGLESAGFDGVPWATVE